MSLGRQPNRQNMHVPLVNLPELLFTRFLMENLYIVSEYLSLSVLIKAFHYLPFTPSTLVRIDGHRLT